MLLLNLDDVLYYFTTLLLPLLLLTYLPQMPFRRNGVKSTVDPCSKLIRVKSRLDPSDTLISHRVRSKINLHFQVLRRTHGKARGGRIAGYLTNEQRSHAGWIGASKCEVIFERAHSNPLDKIAVSQYPFISLEVDIHTSQ